MQNRNLKTAVYLRVSTCDSRQNPDSQLIPLQNYVQARGWTIYNIYSDQADGGREDRAALKQLFADAHKRLFDVVLVFRFDRFARSTKQLIQALEIFHCLGIDFVSYQENIETTTPSGKMMFTIISAFAEFEKAIIRERVMSGLQRAKAQGKKLGRPKITGEEIKKIRKLVKDGMSLRETARALNISKSAVQKYSREAGQTVSKAVHNV